MRCLTLFTNHIARSVLFRDASLFVLPKSAPKCRANFHRARVSIALRKVSFLHSRLCWLCGLASCGPWMRFRLVCRSRLRARLRVRLRARLIAKWMRDTRWRTKQQHTKSNILEADVDSYCTSPLSILLLTPGSPVGQ